MQTSDQYLIRLEFILDIITYKMRLIILNSNTWTHLIDEKTSLISVCEPIFHIK